MSKRFTDSDKWDDDWFFELSNEQRLTWIYVLDKCNHAGIFKVNMKLMNFCLRHEYSSEQVKQMFGDRIIAYHPKKWFLPKYIEFQYGSLNERNRVHNSVIQVLKKEGLWKVYRKSLLALKDKDKDKDIDKDKDKDKDKPNPDVRAFIAFFMDEFKKRSGKAYSVTKGKDGMIVKELLKTYPLNELKQIAIKYFDSTDDFIIKAGYSIGVFRATINKVISQKNTKPERSSKL